MQNLNFDHLRAIGVHMHGENMLGGRLGVVENCELIGNPFMSLCGRFEVSDPVEYYSPQVFYSWVGEALALNVPALKYVENPSAYWREMTEKHPCLKIAETGGGCACLYVETAERLLVLAVDANLPSYPQERYGVTLFEYADWDSFYSGDNYREISAENWDAAKCIAYMVEHSSEERARRKLLDQKVLDSLADAFAAYTEREGLPEEADAEELLLRSDLTKAQRTALESFVETWDCML